MKIKEKLYAKKEEQRSKKAAGKKHERGVFTPPIGPRIEGGYELNAGHRRKAVCEPAGIKAMLVVVRDLDDDAATIIMVDSNQQRENLMPSEKVFSYKMKLEAIKRQGQRIDLTSVQLGQKFISRESIGESNGVSSTQIQRYILLTSLIPEILRMGMKNE